MSAISSALQGMHAAESSLDRTASRLANLPSATAPPTGDTVDLSTEMVNLMQARNNFDANVKVAKTADEMDRSTLSMLG
jgi:flagellar basal body rod protein FlgC